MINKLTKIEFIDRARNVHGEKYDYGFLEYKNSSSKVKIICRKHGGFEQKANSHLQGRGCIKCSGLEKLNTETFIIRANDIHNFKYDYSSSVYINSHTEVKIKCPIHGEFFQKAHKHLNGSGCKSCGYEKNAKELLSNTDEFVNKSLNVHGNLYDYSYVKYSKSSEKIDIICKKHGIFKQTPRDHLRGRGCPLCRCSHLEASVRNFLLNLKISFEEQKRFAFIKNINPLPFDFYLPEYNCCIECQGEQHFKKFRFRGYTDSEFKEIIFNDEIKFNKCKEHKINLFYFCRDLKFIDGKMYTTDNTFNNLEELFRNIQKNKNNYR